MMGIYSIMNKQNRKVYVGQSINIQRRFKHHIDALERGRHHSKKLQKDYDEFGIEMFTFEIIELCQRDQLDEKERYWMSKFDSLRSGYNVQDLGVLSKRKTNPALTIRGEVSRIIREVSFGVVEDLDNYIKGNRKAVRAFISTVAVFISVLTVIVVGGLILPIIGEWIVLYSIFWFLTFAAFFIIFFSDEIK